jgi:diphosphomevalonate decarboxylase
MTAVPEPGSRSLAAAERVASHGHASATAEARANIAFVKYWGRVDDRLNLPLNDSVSLTLDRLVTTTTVTLDPALRTDELELNGKAADEKARARAERHLDRLRARAGRTEHARIRSSNAFTTAGGLASSASGFAALTVAGASALGLSLSPTDMSRIARLGSGSASRSLFGGYVRWKGGTDETSVAEPIAPAGHWDLRDVIVIVDPHEKAVGSTDGHSLARTSPFLEARLQTLPNTLKAVEAAIHDKDLRQLGPVVESEAISMHAVMMTSSPSLLYWAPDTVRVLQALRGWRDTGLEAWATLDAGPNPHILCEPRTVPVLERFLDALGFGPSQRIVCGPGEGPRVLASA